MVFYCGNHGADKIEVHQLVADCGFVGLDAGPLQLARELEAPGRLHRAGLVGIAEAERLLREITDPVQMVRSISRVSDQPVFATGVSYP